MTTQTMELELLQLVEWEWDSKHQQTPSRKLGTMYHLDLRRMLLLRELALRYIMRQLALLSKLTEILN